jgi:formylglycine-generating enzyme required for sulfatase activity
LEAKLPSFAGGYAAWGEGTEITPKYGLDIIPYVPTEKLLPETFLKVEPAILELSAECKIGDDSLKWSLDYEASMSAGIDFSILGKTIEKVETTLYKSPKVNVLNGKGLLCPTPTPIPGSNMPPSNPTAGQEWTNPKDGSVLIWVPSGTFQMGTNDFPGTYLGPVHSVTLSGFWMGKYEVTVGQYRAFCTATGRLMPTATPSWGWIDSHPMVYVDWNDAVAYGTWSGLKLPTEAQWEYAASGGDGRKWPWGNTWDGSRCANSVNPNSLSSTKPVGSYPSGVSPFGMLDMAGNVGEWCGDWSGPYGSGNATNPTGPSSGTSKTVRGGSWDSGGSVDGSGVLRCTWRSGNTPSNAYNSWGFRLSYPLPAP